MMCDKCLMLLDYNERWDAYYCSKCNEWVEKQCSDAECYYCVGRPKNPV